MATCSSLLTSSAVTTCSQPADSANIRPSKTRFTVFVPESLGGPPRTSDSSRSSSENAQASSSMASTPVKRTYAHQVDFLIFRIQGRSDLKPSVFMNFFKEGGRGKFDGCLISQSTDKLETLLFAV